jgi:hypothetical protein
MLAIGCGYPDGNDFDWLRRDVAFKLACGRLPDTGRDLCSQPTISRWENAPTLREIIRLTYALVDIWCGSYRKPPPSVVLDIDDTVDVVHGHQQLAQWNAHLLFAPPCLRRSAQSHRTALLSHQPLGSAEVTHPFHPLHGQRFVVLKVRRVAGVEAAAPVVDRTVSLHRVWFLVLERFEPHRSDDLVLKGRRRRRGRDQRAAQGLTLRRKAQCRQ